jgi:hypothetical protein
MTHRLAHRDDSSGHIYTQKNSTELLHKYYASTYLNFPDLERAAADCYCPLAVYCLYTYSTAASQLMWFYQFDS